jgi:hypothetical protein
MGSSHTGRFGDYPPSKGKKDGPEQPGGGSGDDPCQRDLSNVTLDEVGRSAYFSAHTNVPAVGTTVVLRSTRVGPRLSIDTTDGQSIGFLPTEFNYLAVCIQKGFTYSGEVSSTAQRPAPTVRIDLRATRK